MLHLLVSRRFGPLFWTQFLSAFSDNFLKTSIVFLILGTLPGNGSLVTLAGGVFMAPFFFLSALGGELADRHDKAKIAQRLKLAEFGSVAVAIVGFLSHSLPILFVALFLFGVVAALFGPVKYAILPDLLRREELPGGNALVEGATFLAILTGGITAGVASNSGADPAQLAGLLTVFSAACYAVSLAILPTVPADPTLRINPNILASTVNLVAIVRRDRRLWLMALYGGWFWLVGAVIMSLMPPFVREWLGGGDGVVTVYLAVFAIAIALGSALAAWMSAGRIVLLPCVAGAFLLAVFSADLAFVAWGLAPVTEARGVADFFADPRSLRVTFDLFAYAVSAGLLIVPSFAALQAWAEPATRARAVAAASVVSAGFIVVGAVGLALLQQAGFSPSALFAMIAAGSLAATVFIARTLPTSWLRDLLSILYRAVFRMEVHGAHNLAAAGPNAIIALNHVSFLDAGLALSLTDREPVFAIDSGIAARWWVKPFLKVTRAMPLDPTKPMATRTLINAVRAGETLVIFPEGRLTVTGALMKVYDGAGLIADKSGAKVVPVKIDGLEATPFSRLKRSQVRRRWFPKVTVTVLEPVSLDVDPAIKGRARRMAAGNALYGIMSDLIFRTFDMDRTIFRAVADAAHVHGWSRVAVEDPVTGKLTYRRLLAGADALGRVFAAETRTGEAVGVMLPNATATAATVLGLMSAGRVPAMINFTAGAANIRAACAAVKATTIVTSRTFVEKGRLEPLVAALEGIRFVYLEDLRERIGRLDRLAALARAGRPIEARRPDEPAAILFTSGSEGTPKAVVLSHRNMLANAAQAAARIDFGREDKVFNVLPMFHSFGLTGGFILPLVSGVPVVLYPTPLHYRIVPELVYASNATILFGTDTFLNGYARSAHPYDFRSLRYVLAGAEPVRDSTRRTFLEKFGVRILEGYGVTETAPVLAINTPMHNRFGTVGRMMPGMEARLEPVVGIEEGGRLFVRGPNVMLGYMRAENPGVLEPPPEGWHDTGDIVTIDPEGFITIRGRAKRFAKVGGEMVSLAAVEALAGELWPGRLSAATNRPDPRKGERIVLVTDEPSATREAFQRFARERGATELMMPAEVVVLGKLPVLGSGKVDHPAVARLVADRAVEAA
jgi:acyl-[acyl-carrier-protein]-phospholipid O-acyltransferase/long-chain-fatty-acid--[acyl-carrier-protein] ligase